jgi:hypothetical protein
MAGSYGRQPYRHLWADCLEDVGASTSHTPMGLHGLLQGRLYVFAGLMENISSNSSYTVASRNRRTDRVENTSSN